MPKRCNDHDLVLYTQSKPTKEPAPPVQPIPDFTPFVYINKQNTPCIPSTIDSSNPEALFDLFFFNESTIQMIIKAINENAAYKRAKAGKTEPLQRPWHDVNTNEILAYLGITIFMGCQRLRTIEEYWNTQAEKEPFSV